MLTSITYSPSPNIWLTLGFVRLALSLFAIWGLLRVNGYKSIGYRVTVGVLLKVVSVGHLEAVKLVADNGDDADDGDSDHDGDADDGDDDNGVDDDDTDKGDADKTRQELHVTKKG